MKLYKEEQVIAQLEQRKGGYCYLSIKAEVVEKFKHKRNTRLICTLDKVLTFQCGLNHLGDGNFFIILSAKNLKALNKRPGDTVRFELAEDPNPLGVAMPEVLTAMLAQDDTLNDLFQRLTDGKKRGIIHQLNRIKDIDKQIQQIGTLIRNGGVPRAKKNY
jgi:hypothetical protein